jgi:hypothetical protein
LHYILCWSRTLYYVREVLKKSSNFFRKTQMFFGVATHRHRPMSIGRFVWKNVDDDDDDKKVSFGKKVKKTEKFNNLC